ncbi:presenilin family intramembrane aspartyl protease PSH [Halobellus ordinarius]|uniref:presenilin family intramembrane aspartyl protease PSH n=1 Tax=Halobellus ordinarius TaxID=3075120 RepID=UPI0028803068|nr:presenilin family intramembrane aspartyl protease PSH [Halobellus sp. ZY16]
MRKRVAAGVGFAALLFLLVQLGALALVPTFYEQGYQTVEDPSDPTNSLVYIGAILVATALMLAAFKFDLDWIVRGFVVLAAASVAWYVFSVLLPPLAAVGASVALAALLVVHPEWYVIDAAGVVMGAGAAGLFGISFGLLPALLLLSVLAVYDAISVYGTEHMLDLAEGVMDLNLPVVLVVPTTLSYSLADARSEAIEGEADSDDSEDAIDDGEAATDDDEDANVAGDDGARSDLEEDGNATVADDAETAASDEEDDVRDAFFIGLGDAVIPTVLIASAAFFLPSSLTPSLGVPGLPALTLPALTAMIGTFAGLFALLWMVLKGRAHAGLPLLNGGAILGYLLGALASGVPLLTALGL